MINSLLVLAWMGCQQNPAENASEAKETAPAPANKAEQTETAPKTPAQEAQEFGGEFTIAEAIPASDLFAAPDAFVGKTVHVEGQVSDVCQKMGCWMVISEGEEHMRVTTKGHNFFVAKDGSGSKCAIEGTVIKKEANPERTEHFKSESSAEAPIPKGELENKATYEIVASAIKFFPKSPETAAESTKQ